MNTEQPVATAPALSFFADRMQQLGVTNENILLEVYDPEVEFPQKDRYITEVFGEDKRTGDIEILYYRVNGELITYEQVGDGKTSHLNAKRKAYKTRRLKEPKGDMKYQMPAGIVSMPWFPPALVQKYKNKVKIPTLILTEGVFKAMCGSIVGLDVVGLPSITNYKQRDGKLYEDIVLLIEACEVVDVVILWDGDCLGISKKDLQRGEELTTRPATFFNSAKKIAELIGKIDFAKTREKVNTWFAHVKMDSLPGRPKGLDDLIIQARSDDRVGRIVEEMTDLTKKPFFFYTRNITSGTANLVKYFRLNDYKDFYEYHRELIENREFKFKGSSYRWSDVLDELQLLTPEWAEKVKWVGDEFFLEDVVPGAVTSRRKLLAYKQGQFTKLYGDKFWEYLTHHKAFCNIPNHFEYRQVIETADGSKYYNRYFPFPHVPEEGTWPTILGFIKHIFGTHKIVHGRDASIEYDAWELGIDYIQILLKHPTQMLPILCLFSPENNTGKSTLGKLLMHMFGDNAVPIGNSDLQSDFNEMFVDKLLAVCDETLLDRKRDAERIKAMSTAEQIMVNPKGQKQYSIDYFCKFLFTSNNIRMVYVSKHDERYWIIRVPKLTQDDPKILDKMNAELPAFIHSLMNRTLATHRESRMHFHPSLIRTKVFEDVVRVNEPSDATNLRDQLREWFIQDGEIQEICMTLKEIRTEFFSNNTSIAWIQEILKDYIGADLKRDLKGEAVFERGTYTKYELFINTDGEEDIRPVRKAYRGRPYVFKREAFLSDGEVHYTVTAPESVPAPSHPPVIQTAMEFDEPANAVSSDLPF